MIVGCTDGPDVHETPPNATSARQVVSERDNGRIEWPETTQDLITVIDETQLLNAPVHRPVPRVTLGSGIGGEQDEFGAIGGLALDSIGRLYVWDTYAYRVRVYGADSKFVRDFGGRGTGPGKFTRPGGVWEWETLNGIAISHDTVYVLDKVLHAFDTSGTYLSSSAGKLPIYNANSIVAGPSGLIFMFSLSRESTVRRMEFVTADFRREGAAVDSFVVTQYFYEYGDPLHRGTLPHVSFPYSIASNGLHYFGVGDSLHIDARRGDGSDVTTLVAPVGKTPVERRDKADFMEAVEESMRQISRMSEERYERELGPQLRAWYDRRQVAPHRQAISAIIASESGSVLLARPDISEKPYRRYDQGEFTKWTWLDASGRVRAHIELPNSFLPKVFSKCALYGVRHTEDGTQHVVHYDLSESGC